MSETNFNEATRNLALDAIPITHISLHSADPGTNGANELPTAGRYARQTISYEPASGGVRSKAAGDIVFEVDSGASVQWHGLWDGATYRGKYRPTNGETYGGDGEYVITDSTITMSNVNVP